MAWFPSVPTGPTSKQIVPRREVVVCGLIFLACFLLFRHAPMQQTGGDDRYSLLLAENLLRHRDFALERYGLPTPDYRIEDVGEHRYYGFPPGTSVLSVPYVALMHLRGKSALRGGAYDLEGEMGLESRLAALLMAAFAVTVFLTSRLLLPVAWSVAVTVASALGTQVFSSISRALWSDTWGVFLVGLAVFMLLRSAVRRRPPNLPLLATIEVWAYVVRPTNSLALVGTAVYLLVTMRRAAWPFLVAAGAWLCCVRRVFVATLSSPRPVVFRGRAAHRLHDRLGRSARKSAQPEPRSSRLCSVGPGNRAAVASLSEDDSLSNVRRLAGLSSFAGIW